jgi:hypothetical protein
MFENLHASSRDETCTNNNQISMSQMIYTNTECCGNDLLWLRSCVSRPCGLFHSSEEHRIASPALFEEHWDQHQVEPPTPPGHHTIKIYINALHSCTCPFKYKYHMLLLSHFSALLFLAERVAAWKMYLAVRSMFCLRQQVCCNMGDIGSSICHDQYLKAECKTGQFNKP